MSVKPLTTEEFIKTIFDFQKHEEWQYEGKLPAIIDFYADWCGPCKAVAPILEELAGEYKNMVDIYKVDSDKETVLSQLFNIQSIPTFLFIPMQGAPMVQRGALPKSVFKQVIEDRLLKSSTTNDVAAIESKAEPE